jgi:hypothetical protein
MQTQVRLPGVAMAAVVETQARVAGAEAPSRAAVLVAAAAGLLLLWSASYLVRQGSMGGVEPAEAMRGAIEGMALALAWLGALIGGCVAVLSGIVTIRETGS